MLDAYYWFPNSVQYALIATNESVMESIISLSSSQQGFFVYLNSSWITQAYRGVKEEG